MVSKRTEELLELDRKYLIHGFSVVGEKEVGPVIERADGVRCWDTEGNAYFDAGSQQTSNTLGHGQKDIIDAICEQVQKLQFAHLLGRQSNVPIIEYARDLAQVVPPGLDHFYFTSGGSEAVETAFKLTRLYWSKQGKGKYKIISIQDSYHGAGMGSAAATRAGSGAFWTGYAPLASGFVQAPYFYCNRCPFHLEYPTCNVLCARYVEEIIKKEGADSVAAYIAEPVMGAAGNIAPPPEYFPIVRQICTDYDVFLIADEVQTGFGRTGRMWAQEHWNVKWDVMTAAKSINGCYLPFGATLISDRIYQGLQGSMLWHGWTQHGNPVCAAAAKAALKLITRDKLVQNGEMVGNYVLERLNGEFKGLPNVSDIGGKGLMLGLELVRDKATNEPFDAATMSKWQREVLQKGLYVRMALAKDYTRVRFNPPIITTREEADEMLDILYAAIADLKSK
ncbi:MAG: aspartate aminotransferase family protein [Dehalococcoidales bacterium]